MGDATNIVALLIGIVVAGVVGVIGFLIVKKIYEDKIDLRLLISEKNPPDNPASISRFQLLIFTFVISLSLFYIVVKTGRFPKISPEILTLLGISGGTYVISKGIR